MSGHQKPAQGPSPPGKPVRGSENHVWFQYLQLGGGAMGTVHEGRHRRKGTKCAVKVFKPEVKMMMNDFLQRELDILKELPTHRNIVKFIGVESETYSRDQVVVMELCEGGSVQQLLEQPQNHYGLPEGEFSLFFIHVANALGHLYEHNIIHRDIKPGNVLQFIASDGSHVYKLTDFGTAKTLRGKCFKSLCGTEEYLHPGMHEAAFLKRRPDQVYDHSVDLWSYGVSIYQCATGKLPFLPRDGVRQNKQMMQKLMCERSSDVISQIELDNGTIESFTDLPSTCLLSSGIKRKVRSVLRDVFNITRPPDPQSVFRKVSKFSHSVTVHVFSISSGLQSFHLKPSARLPDLQDAIQQQTGVSIDNQVIFLDESPIVNTTMETDALSSYPVTSADQPLYLYDLSENISEAQIVTSVPDMPPTPTNSDVHRDARWAKTVCGTVCHTQQVVENTVLYQKHVLRTRWLIHSFTKKRQKELELALGSVKKLTLYQKGICDLIPSQNQQLADSQTFKVIRHNMDELGQIELELKQSLELHGDLEPYVRRQLQPPCEKDRCRSKALKRMTDSMPLYKGLQEDKTKEMSHNDIEIHKYNMSELKRKCRGTQDLFKDHCLQKKDQTLQNTIGFMQKLTRISHIQQSAEDRINSINNATSTLSEQLFTIIRECWKTTDSKVIKNTAVATVTPMMQKKSKCDVSKEKDLREEDALAETDQSPNRRATTNDDSCQNHKTSVKYALRQFSISNQNCNTSENQSLHSGVWPSPACSSKSDRDAIYIRSHSCGQCTDISQMDMPLNNEDSHYKIDDRSSIDTGNNLVVDSGVSIDNPEACRSGGFCPNEPHSDVIANGEKCGINVSTSNAHDKENKPPCFKKRLSSPQTQNSQQFRKRAHHESSTIQTRPDPSDQSVSLSEHQLFASKQTPYTNVHIRNDLQLLLQWTELQGYRTISSVDIKS